jgi:hypothetical protein
MFYRRKGSRYFTGDGSIRRGYQNGGFQTIFLGRLMHDIFLERFVRFLHTYLFFDETRLNLLDYVFMNQPLG